LGGAAITYLETSQGRILSANIDSCSGSTKVFDYYCENGAVQSRELSCDCRNLVSCMPAGIDNCEEGEMGVNFEYDDGYALRPYTFANQCVENILIKYACADFRDGGYYYTWPKVEVEECENGCKSGKCVNTVP